MPRVKILHSIAVGKGCTLRLCTDLDAPDNSIEQYFTEFTYDAEPDSVPFEVLAHWHKNHDEIMLVLEGRIAITIEGKTIIATANDGPITIPRWKWHSIKSLKGERVVIRERTNPGGSFKPQFFYDLFSRGIPPPALHSLRSFYDGDGYISLPGNIKLIDQIVSIFLGLVAKTLLFFDRKPRHF